MVIEEQRVQGLSRHRRGSVQLALGFFDDDDELTLQLVPVDQAPSQRVGLQIERNAEAFGRQHGVIGSVIVAGPGVEIPSRELHLRGDRSDPTGGSSLEQHVLQHMAHAGQRVGLVEESRANVIDGGDGGSAGDGLRQEGKAVRQHLTRDPLGPALVHCPVIARSAALPLRRFRG